MGSDVSLPDVAVSDIAIQVRASATLLGVSDSDTPRKFCEAWLSKIGLAIETYDAPGTTVVPVEDRRGSGFAACYRLGLHRVVLSDPDLADELAGLQSEILARTDGDLRDFAASRGWEFISGGIQKTLAAPFEPDRLLENGAFAGYRSARLDWGRREDLDATARLVDVSSDDDLDDAELEMDNLDDHAVAIFDPAGEIAAYASARSWWGSYGDIGVITRSDERSKGLGRAVVSALISDAMPDDWEPLYRHDTANAGSHRLSAGLGFVVAADLLAIGPATPA